MRYSRVTVIVNPASGGGKSLRSAARIPDELKGCVREVELAQTRRQGDATDSARKAAEAGSELIVAVGGDGTVNEVINGISEARESTGRDCVLAIIPYGTSSSLARELRIPHGLAAAKLIREGKARTIDLIALNWVTQQRERKRRLAATIVNFGFGGAVARSVRPRVKKLGGFLAFAAIGTAKLTWYRSAHTAVELDGREIARSRIFCTIVANTQWEGGGMHVAPEARPDDGLLDVVVVEDLPLLSRLRHFPKVYTGRHINLPVVMATRGRRITIKPDDMLPFEFDGECAECRECSIELIPKALKIIVPS